MDGSNTKGRISALFFEKGADELFFATRDSLFRFQIARAFVDFASPCFQHCLRLVFAAQTI
jgi:hypothetical protein